jgi:mannose-6-phosphate isomerase-like protein (cupin superfamily)
MKKVKKVKKVWGEEKWIVNNELYCYKKLYLYAGYRCSFHMHKIKDETFIIESGLVGMEYGDEYKKMFKGDQVRIKPNVYHRFTGITDSVIIEISTTHSDDDSYRKTESEMIEDE